MDRNAYAELLALRGLMTAWIASSLAHNKDAVEQLRILEEFAQFELSKLKLDGSTEAEQTIVKEIASNRISTILASASGGFL